MGNNILGSGIGREDDSIELFSDISKQKSGVYEEINRFSLLAFRPIPIATCRHLLNNLPIWKDLPYRVRSRIEEEILDFMSGTPMPTQYFLEQEIRKHPVVQQYFQGELPASREELAIEQDERVERQSDIEALRKIIRAETEMAGKLGGLSSFDAVEIPTKRDTPSVSAGTKNGTSLP